jgi:NitT/TauT family transport system ATP-binding protein
MMENGAAKLRNAVAIAGRNLSFIYDSDGKDLIVVKNFDITVISGEVICLFGPNGCGKSTLLRLCAGLLSPSNGSITVLDKPSSETTVGYIPQAFSESLFPWLTNLDNIAFPLYMNGISKKEARARAEDTALKLSDSLPLRRHPREISIGQQQLVCLARALVLEPPVLIADEPFSALDFQTRRDIQDVFHRVLAPESRIGALLVSHQVEDAVYMADKVIVTSSVPMMAIDVFDILEDRPRSQRFFAAN